MASTIYSAKQYLLNVEDYTQVFYSSTAIPNSFAKFILETFAVMFLTSICVSLMRRKLTENLKKPINSTMKLKLRTPSKM